MSYLHCEKYVRVCCVTSSSASVNEALLAPRCMWHLSYTMEVMTQHSSLYFHSSVLTDLMGLDLIHYNVSEEEYWRLVYMCECRCVVRGVFAWAWPASCRVWTAVPAVCSQWPCFLSCASVPRYSLTEPLPTWRESNTDRQTERCTVMDEWKWSTLGYKSSLQKLNVWFYRDVMCLGLGIVWVFSDTGAKMVPVP